jgi:hypothetical protein
VSRLVEDALAALRAQGIAAHLDMPAVFDGGVQASLPLCVREARGRALIRACSPPDRG